LQNFTQQDVFESECTPSPISKKNQKDKIRPPGLPLLIA
jgi:hypothetical protein